MFKNYFKNIAKEETNNKLFKIGIISAIAILFIGMSENSKIDREISHDHNDRINELVKESVKNYNRVSDIESNLIDNINNLKREVRTLESDINKIETKLG